MTKSIKIVPTGLGQQRNEMFVVLSHCLSEMMAQFWMCDWIALTLCFKLYIFLIFCAFGYSDGNDMYLYGNPSPASGTSSKNFKGNFVKFGAN